MNDRYLIGVDLGTSATKAAIYHRDGRLVAEASAEVPLYYPGPGAVEQENDDFYRSAAQAVRQCLAESGIDPRSVAAIACDSQMAGVGAVDEHFWPVTRFDSWLDVRCQPYLDYLEREHGELITRLTGCPPICDHGPKIVWWREEHPESYARTAKYVMPAGYVAGRMAGLRGERAFIDYTFIHFSALCDARAGEWSPELCGLLGVDRAKLPRIVAPWEIIGEVRDEAAGDFGLAPGTPIAAGCGDTAAGALGAGIVRPGMLLDTAGTAAVLAGCTDRFTPDVEHRVLFSMRSVIPGLWHPLAYVAGGGLALRWFADTFCRGDSPCEPRVADEFYAHMAAEAAVVPAGSEGLFFSPHLGGRICPAEPAMRGAWVGLSWRHGRPYFYRAILESIAFEYAYYLRILRDLAPDLSLLEARVIGGGARSPEWNQIKADVLDVPYRRLRRPEFATWGSALVAGRAVGLVEDIASAASVASLPDGAPAYPRPEAVAVYARLAQRYAAWQTTLAEAFRAQARTERTATRA
ncbi:MAG: FGGY-family carbohydrate kinase [Anaerolineae bacterium]